jgi:hypothetical protein
VRKSTNRLSARSKTNKEIDTDSSSDLSDLLENDKNNLGQGLPKARQQARDESDAESNFAKPDSRANNAYKRKPVEPFSDHQSAFSDSGNPLDPQVQNSTNFNFGRKATEGATRKVRKDAFL